MKILAAALLLLAAPAYATTTWSEASPSLSASVKAVCTTGTEAAPTLSTAGIPLTNVATLDVYVCADSGATITTGASFVVYLYDYSIALWSKTDLALTVPTGGRCGYARGDSPGKGIPILARRGRLAVVPAGAAVSAGSITIWHMGTGTQGNAT